jgi:hypothetical protein
MEVEAFRTRGLDFDPDVVVLGFIYNDLDLPNLLWGAGESPWTLRRSLLLAWLGQRLGVAGGPPILAPRLLGSTRYREKGGDASDPEAVAERFRPLVGREAYLGALDDLRSIATDRGMRVAALAHSSEPDAGVEVLSRFLEDAEQRGFLVVDDRPALDAERRRHGLGPTDLWRTPDDRHPSPRAHAVIARALAEALSADAASSAALGGATRKGS